MGASKTIGYHVRLRIWYLTENTETTEERAAQIILDTYEKNPWFTTQEVSATARRTRRRVMVPVKASIQPNGGSFAYMLALRTKLYSNQLYAFEQYRQQLTKAIFDAADPGVWQVNVEVQLSSGEPYSIFSPIP